MKPAGRKKLYIYIVFLLIVIVSRLPFITSGYGSEEDCWGLRLTAENISRSGNYEVSRLPGHPFQEIIYSYIWQYGHVAMNLLTVLISSTGILFFVLVLDRIRIASSLPAGIALAFTPVVYINSSNVMDYSWAMSFIIASFYFIVIRKNVAAGLLLGIAIGCRITSGAMLIPFVAWLFFANADWLKRSAVLVLITLLTSALCYLPVINNYGISFFTYYQHFPLPALAKNIYKGSIAVWGLPMTLLLMGIFSVYTFRLMHHAKTLRGEKRFAVTAVCLLAVLLYCIAFFRLPLKAAFMIPLVPFVIMLVANYSSQKLLWLMALTAVLSSFFFGVNLADANRGSVPSAISYSARISGQDVTFDLLKGPLIADMEKQRNMIEYSKQVIAAASEIDSPVIIIAGWYLNFIDVLNVSNNPLVKYVYYIDEKELTSYILKGVPVYYLKDQDHFNDLRFGSNVTAKVANPLPGV